MQEMKWTQSLSDAVLFVITIMLLIGIVIFLSQAGS